MREADFGFVAVFSDFKSDLCAIPLGPGRESSPDLQLRTLPCCSVTLPALWNSHRESNPDLLIRQSVGPKRHGQYFQSGFRRHDGKLTVQGESWRATLAAFLLICHEFIVICHEFIDRSCVCGFWTEWKEICSGLFTGGSMAIDRVIQPGKLVADLIDHREVENCYVYTSQHRR
jgi:hypothetical protein